MVFAAEAESRPAEKLRLLVQPTAVVVLVGAVLGWAFTRDLDAAEQRNVNVPTILRLTWEHVEISAVVAAIVLVVAVPLGMLLTRGWARAFVPVALGIANLGQAAPALGMLVLFFVLTEGTGFWVAVLPLSVYALLPVLRNTMVGIQQVDPALIDAGRGIGMSSLSVLLRIELPLAVPHILAGLRTALVLAVGTATLAVFVGAGGLGALIDTGFKLYRYPIMVVGAVLAMALALLIDWLAALAERFLGPKGLR